MGTTVALGAYRLTSIPTSLSNACRAPGSWGPGRQNHSGDDRERGDGHDTETNGSPNKRNQPGGGFAHAVGDDTVEVRHSEGDGAEEYNGAGDQPGPGLRRATGEATGRTRHR